MFAKWVKAKLELYRGVGIGTKQELGFYGNWVCD